MIISFIGGPFDGHMDNIHPTTKEYKLLMIPDIDGLAIVPSLRYAVYELQVDFTQMHTRYYFKEYRNES